MGWTYPNTVTAGGAQISDKTSAQGQKAKYSPGVEDFRIAPKNGHRQSSRTLLGI